MKKPIIDQITITVLDTGYHLNIRYKDGEQTKHGFKLLSDLMFYIETQLQCK